jgi:two-component system, OmpR family, sensor kinase
VGNTRPRSRRFPHGLLGTLGSRLLAGVVAVVLVVVAITGAATYLSLHRYLFGRLDKQVLTSAQGVIRQAVSTHGYGGLGPSPQKVWVAAFEPDGTELNSSSLTNASTVQMKLSASDQRALIAHQDQHRTVTTTDGESLRVTSQLVTVTVQRTTSNGVTYGPQAVVFLVGLSTEEISKTMRALVLLELGIGAAAVLLAFGVTAWGVRVSLGPLKRVTRTAQEVTAELSPAGAGLERRVPETDSSTEVGQLAMSFNTMLDTVQTEFTARRESEERMRQFLADASHELRTPLTSIRGYAELARMQKARNDANGIVTADDGTDDTIGRIETEGTRMSRLVEDLLILARGDDPNDNSAEREVVELDEVVQDAITDLRLGYPDRIVSTDIQPGLRVMGDRDQLLRLVRNLTVNAAVHTDADGPIRVTAQRDADNVVVQVIDAGPGLAPEEAAHVFERFWRADRARTRVRGGSGLGMAIVAQIVSAHGGRAFFDSSVPGGSTVTLVLPAIA